MIDTQDIYVGPRIKSTATMWLADDPKAKIDVDIAAISGGYTIINGLPDGPWLLATPGTYQVKCEKSTLASRRHGFNDGIDIENEEYAAIKTIVAEPNFKEYGTDLRLSLVSQVAAESIVNDYKAAKTLHPWVKSKFKEHKVEHKFNAYWGLIQRKARQYQENIFTIPIYYRNEQKIIYMFLVN